MIVAKKLKIIDKKAKIALKEGLKLIDEIKLV